MEKFTKAPWEIKSIEDDKEYIRIRGTVPGERFKVCNAIDAKEYHKEGLPWCKFEREESMANAHLIAAAPDMYALLDKLSPMLTDINAHLVVNEIDALLAKARGENE